MSTGDVLVYFGDKVVLDDGCTGQVRFIGELVGKKEICYGIELTTGKGKNNGTLDGVTYFKVKSKTQLTGRLVTRSKIQKTMRTSQSSRYTIDQNVVIKGVLTGVVRYVGVPTFATSTKVHYGIELHEPKGDNDGSKRGQKYFTCAAKHGIFVSNESSLTSNEEFEQAKLNRKQGMRMSQTSIVTKTTESFKDEVNEKDKDKDKNKDKDKDKDKESPKLTLSENRKLPMAKSNDSPSKAKASTTKSSVNANANANTNTNTNTNTNASTSIIVNVNTPSLPPRRMSQPKIISTCSAKKSKTHTRTQTVFQGTRLTRTQSKLSATAKGDSHHSG
ncbi:hypothetical protein RFI_12001 [Reticulomyxa filosa]|uniref:CAP-Gly domain-containing protein n=1 Tax=Reticulomyxa filosa TaxID=46433 RepID=X6NGV9_RETFI|nr:hypothetical protein RFI_12001 [Reticulomyxa filosa]|eukprot:ETO25143.1 hypothetical protein RFI_12001 [Reticulomyxa filosa]